MQQKELLNASLEMKEKRAIMQTATIVLENRNDEENRIKQSVQVLLDSGSQRTYISKDIICKLKLTPIDKTLRTIYTFGTTKLKYIETPVVDMTMMLKIGFTMKIKTNRTLLVQLKEHHSDLKPSINIETI